MWLYRGDAPLAPAYELVLLIHFRDHVSHSRINALTHSKTITVQLGETE